MDVLSIACSPPTLAEDQLGFFRWGRIAGKVLVSTDAGEWIFLSEQEFSEFLAGRITDQHPRFPELKRKDLLRDGLDLDRLAAGIARRHRHLSRGPHLHVINLSRVCVQNCPYCAAAQAATGEGDLSQETADRIIAFAMQSTSPFLNFTFQARGGEPLQCFETLRHIVESVRVRAVGPGKTVHFAVFSNFSAMTQELAEWLIQNDVQVWTTLDGPAEVHDRNRRWKHGSSHADVVRWLDFFQCRYRELGRDPNRSIVEALITVTRDTFENWRAVIDEYVTRGLRTIHLRPLNPSGLTQNCWAEVGYTAEEYLEFYHRALDYIFDLNAKGVELTDRMASIFVTKILNSTDPGVVDIQTPSGEGTNQIAYDVDGRVFPCDEAVRLDALGDSLFALGEVDTLTQPALLTHPTVRAIAAASLLDVQPMCSDCWNKPFCGLSPVYNYATQQSLFGQRPRNFKCKEHMSIAARLFQMLDRGDGANILERWAIKSALPGDARASKEIP